MNDLRELRRTAGLSQEAFAQLLDVPYDTFRMWDNGLRPIPTGIVQRAQNAVTEHVSDTELLSLDQLAQEFSIHQRTLRDAVRSGRLDVEFSTRSAFGRPIRLTTRTAVRAFKQRYYKQCYSRFLKKPPRPDTRVPSDCARQLRRLRRQLGITQAELAKKIGAAGKAVVYQWESNKRRPSPVFWRAIEHLKMT